MDIYKSKTPKVDAPVLVFVHGGSWDSGSKGLYKFIGDSFASEGYDIVVPNYRLYPGIKFPDPVADTAKAIAFTARKFEGRPLVLIGHSAGAYNMLMTVFAPQYLKAEGVQACDSILGAISLASPTGVIALTEEPYITIFPDRFTGKDAPMGLTDQKVPPLFLMNGGKDKTVYPQNAVKLAEAVNARGGSAKAVIYPGLDHTDAVKHLSRYFDGDSPLKADLLGFIGGLDRKTPTCR